MDDEALNNLNELINQLESVVEEVQLVPTNSVLHMANERVLDFREKLNIVAQKALAHKVPHVDFLETISKYAEQFMNLNLYSMVFNEMYERWGDLAYRFIRERNYNFQGEDVARAPEPAALEDPVRCASTVMRFLMGRVYCMYRLTVIKDAFFQRRDSVEDIRACLMDLQTCVSYIMNFPDLISGRMNKEGTIEPKGKVLPENQSLKIEERIYVLVYNAIVLGMRISKFLRRTGYGYVAVPFLGWLSVVANDAILPLQNTQFIMFRLRLNMELIYCLEWTQGAENLKNAAQSVETSLAQIRQQTALEELVNPVPREAEEILRTCRIKLQVLKIKYAFWAHPSVLALVDNPSVPGQTVNVPTDIDIATVAGGIFAPDLMPSGDDGLTNVGYLMSAIVETLQLRGPGSFQRVFLDAFNDVQEEGLTEISGKYPKSSKPFADYIRSIAPPCDNVSHLQQMALRRQLLKKAIDLARPFCEKMRNLIILLEKWTCRRKELERIELLKAQGKYEPEPGEEEREKTPEESEEYYEELKNKNVFKNIRTGFPLEMHRAILENCVKLDMYLGEHESVFRELTDVVVLRMKYRHFFDPPLIEIDVLVTETKIPEIPGGYIQLTGDLNYLSRRNRRVAQVEAELAAAADDDDNPKKRAERAMAEKVREKGRHVFLIGKRFDPMDSWPGIPNIKLQAHMQNRTNFPAYVPSSGPETIDSPGIIRRICNVHVEFAVRPPIVGGLRKELQAGIVDHDSHDRFGVLGTSLTKFRGDNFDDIELYKKPEEENEAGELGKSTAPKTDVKCKTEPTKPWLDSDYEAGIADYTLDSSYHEAAMVREQFLTMSEAMVSHRCLPIPIESHPTVLDMGSEKIPFLTFSIYSEKTVHDADAFVKGQKQLSGPYADSSKPQKVPPYYDPVVAQEEAEREARLAKKSSAVAVAVSSPRRGLGELGDSPADDNTTIIKPYIDPTIPTKPGPEIKVLNESELIKNIGMQNWSFQLDDFELALLPISDIGVFGSSQLACAIMDANPEDTSQIEYGEKNAVIKADLRQTPEELLGQPFQNYLFVTCKADQPTAIGVNRQVRLFRLLSELLPPVNGSETEQAEMAVAADERSPQSARNKKVKKVQNDTGAEFAEKSTDIDSKEGAPLSANSVNVDKLMEIIEVLRLGTAGLAGQFFIAENGDLLEDIVGKIYNRCIKPLIKTIEMKRHRETTNEWLLQDIEKGQIRGWCGILRRVLPILLKVMQSIGRFDVLMLSNISWVLARLCVQDEEYKLAVQFLKGGISRLEEELDETCVIGSRTWLDKHPALSISFDPPSLRPKQFAHFYHVSNNYKDDDMVFPVNKFDVDNCELEPSCLGKTRHKPKKNKGPPKIYMDPTITVLREDSMILPVQSRTFQEKSLTLMKLYDYLTYISLHVTRVNRNVLLGVPIVYKLQKSGKNQKFNEDIYDGVEGQALRKMKALGNPIKEDTNKLAIEKKMPGRKKIVEPLDYNPTKLCLSQQEADVVQPYGENPYLRSSFFCWIALQRMTSSNLALTKACNEAIRAEEQEIKQWEYFENQLMVDQEENIERDHNKKKIQNHHVLYKDLTVMNERLVQAIGADDVGGGGDGSEKKKRKKSLEARRPVFFGKSTNKILLRLPSGATDKLDPRRAKDHADQRLWPSLRTTASRVDIAELKNPNLVKGVDAISRNLNVHSQSNGTKLDTYIVYGKEAGIVLEVSELHKLLEGTGVRGSGYDYVQITGLTPNTNYSFAIKEVRGFDVKKGLKPDLDRLGGQPTTAVGMVSHATPAIGAWFPMSIGLLWLNVLEKALLIEEQHNDLAAQDMVFLARNKEIQTIALNRIRAYFTEKTSNQQSSDLNQRKLRVDIASRNPPFVLLRYAQVMVAQQRAIDGYPNLKPSKFRSKHVDVKDHTFTSQRRGQLTILQDINECMIALNAAQRATIDLQYKKWLGAEGFLNDVDGLNASEIIFQTISLILIKIRCLLDYRTKPAVLMQVIVECILALKNVDLCQWDPHSRKMTIYVLHQFLQISNQLRQSPEFSQTVLNTDLVHRYAMLVTRKLSATNAEFFYEKDAAHVTINSICSRGAEAKDYLDYTRGLGLLAAELGFLNYNVSQERIMASLGNDSLLSQSLVVLQSEGAVADPSTGQVVDATLKQLFMELVKPGEQSFIPDYLGLAKGTCTKLTETGYMMGIAFWVLSLSRAKLPPNQTPPEDLGAYVRTLSPEEQQFLETIQTMLDSQPRAKAVKQVLYDAVKALASYGFMLRSLPHHALVFEDETGEKTEEAGGDEDEEDAEAVAAAERMAQQRALQALAAEGVDFLENSLTVKWLAQLEILSATVSIRKLEHIKVNDHTVPHFKYFDLDQLAVPDLKQERLASAGPEDAAALEKERQIAEEEAAKHEQPPWEIEGAELSVPQKRYSEDLNTKELGMQLLKDVVARMARASIYASSSKAQYLLQSCVLISMNALFILSPNPTECISQGLASNFEDLDPDTYVGLTGLAKPASDEVLTKIGKNPEEDLKEMTASCPENQAAMYANDVWENSSRLEVADVDDNPRVLWLNLGLIAQNVVKTLKKLKIEAQAGQKKTQSKRESISARGERMRGNPNDVANSDVTSPHEKTVVEEGVTASKNMSKIGEEVEEFWFASSGLDMTTIAKFIGFTVLCFYHMRRWNQVIEIADGFNKATCAMFGSTFLPFIVGAQKNIVNLSARILAKTKGYIQLSKKRFDEDQRKVPRKLLRQLALLGQLSVPEQLYNKRIYYYENLQKRQQALHKGWSQVLDFFDTSYSMISRTIPAAIEQLRKNRVVLATFEHDKFRFFHPIENLDAARRAIIERNLKNVAHSLVGSYHMSIELLKKRKMTLLATQALHELGNLQWQEGDRKSAGTAWSEGVDNAYNGYECLKNWKNLVTYPPDSEPRTNPWALYAAEWWGDAENQHRFLIEEDRSAGSVIPVPKTGEDVDVMFLSIILIYKFNSYFKSRNALSHIHGGIFVSGILERMLNAYPNPVDQFSNMQILSDFASVKYRLRECFLGFRPSMTTIAPNTCHGGVDGLTFLSGLEFFIKNFHLSRYQVAKSLALCQVHKYVSTDVTRNLPKSIRGKLLAARSFLLIDEPEKAFFELLGIQREQDCPLFPINIARETLDCNRGTGLIQSPDLIFYRNHEAPYSANNSKAIEQLLTWSKEDAAPNSTGTPEQASVTARRFGDDYNTLWFDFLKAEFVVSLCSTKCSVFPTSHPTPEPPGEGQPPNPILEHNNTILPQFLTCQPKWLKEAEELLKKTWKNCVTCCVKGQSNILSSGVPAHKTEIDKALQERFYPEEVDPNAHLDAFATSLHNHIGSYIEVTKIVQEGGKPVEEGSESERLQFFRLFLSPDVCELMIEIRMLYSKIYEIRGLLRQAASEILYAQMFFKLVARPWVDMAEVKTKLLPGQKILGMRKTSDMKYWIVLRLRLCNILDKQGRTAACHTHATQGIAECEKANDVLSKIEFLYWRARTYLNEGRLLEIINPSEGNIGCIPSILELLNLSYTNFSRSQPSLPVIKAKMMLFSVLVQNPTYNDPIYLFSVYTPPPPPDPNAEEDYQAIALANAKKNPSPMATELIDAAKATQTGGKGQVQVGGSSGSSAPVALVVNERDQRRAEFLIQFLEETRQDIEYTLGMQSQSLDPPDVNHLSHYLAEKDDVIFDDRRARQFRSLLPIHGFSWTSNLPINDSRKYPNIYLSMRRLHTILMLQLAAYKLEIAGCYGSDFYQAPKKDFFGRVAAAISYKWHHPTNVTIQFLLQCNQDMEKIEHSIPRILFFPARYVTLFSALKLKWRRLTILEDRIERPFFQSVDPVLEYCLRDGVTPAPLDPLYRAFVARARNRTLTTPNYRWQKDFYPERLATYLNEAKIMLQIAVKEGGQDVRLILSILYECVLEVLASWQHFEVALPQCKRLIGKRVENDVIPEPDPFKVVEKTEEEAAEPAEGGEAVKADEKADEDHDGMLAESSVLLRKYKNNFTGPTYMIFKLMDELVINRNTFETSLLDISKGNADGGAVVGLKSLMNSSEAEQIAGASQVNEDLFLHLQRQQYEGGLEAVYANSVTSSDAAIAATAASVVQYFLSLRKEANANSCFDEEVVQLVDSLHLLLAKYVQSFEGILLKKDSIDKLDRSDSILETHDIIRHYSFDPVTNDADEDTRTNSKDVKSLDLASAVGMCASSAQAGEVFFFWGYGIGESNVFDYPSDGSSVLVMLTDFNVVYKFPGRISQKAVKKCYDVWSEIQKNSASIVLEGFERGYFEDILRQFGTLFHDTRWEFLEEKMRGTGTKVEEDGSLTNEAAEIAINEKLEFRKRAAVPQDDFVELNEDCGIAPAPDATALTGMATTAGGSSAAGVGNSPKRAKSKEADAGSKQAAALERGIANLLDSIGYMKKVDTFTGEADEGVEDKNVLNPENAIVAIKSLVQILNYERRLCTTCHLEVCKFLRTFLPEQDMIIKEARYY